MSEVMECVCTRIVEGQPWLAAWFGITLILLPTSFVAEEISERAKTNWVKKVARSYSWLSLKAFMLLSATPALLFLLVFATLVAFSILGIHIPNRDSPEFVLLACLLLTAAALLPLYITSERRTNRLWERKLEQNRLKRAQTAAK
jgi:hypothetical protein